MGLEGYRIQAGEAAVLTVKAEFLRSLQCFFVTLARAASGIRGKLEDIAALASVER